MILESGELNISQEIEKLVSKTKDGYIQAILTFCEERNIDPSYIAKHLSKPMVEKIKAEGQSLNLLPKSSRLPL